MLEQLDQANAHHIASRLNATEQDEHRMNDELLEVEILLLVLRIGEDRYKVIPRRAPSRFNERRKDLEQSGAGGRVGLRCRFAQHEFRGLSWQRPHWRR